ncbi:lactoylglutathione lyase [Kaistia sp. 32K]|uniref:VOC family protein n=1 Tax=Kaistia sp. 32K TaxID=2795690 RepID=UPI001915B759|nr:VOC family protein [Kaistia sp. 32K]BCP54862.1 lactoylglutathione lyase [Kaistia sp. 32K]
MTPSLHHIAVWVSDLDAAADFWERHFNAIVGPRYDSKRQPGFASRFAYFGQSFRIELMARPGLEPGPDHHLGWTHVALSMGATGAVDAAAERFAALGLLLEGPRRTGDGHYEAVVSGPDGVRIELTV